MNRAREYARMLRVFHRDSVRAEIAYRADFVAGVVLSLFWHTWAVLGLAVFYQFATDIVGWTFPEAVVVLGMFLLMNGFRQLIVSPNLRQMADHIRLGTLDYLLLKPVSAQFMVSLRRFNPILWVDCVIGLALALAGAILHDGVPGPAALLLFAVTLAAALLIVYGLGVLLVALVVITVQAEGLEILVRGAFEVGRFPVDFYGGVTAWIFTFFVPIALITVFPARALLGDLPIAAAGASVAAAALVLALATLVWRAALRSYEGASS
ncbi:hypothetical protein Aple_100160 [Acrocarpospora pleiomorpha]|uniref:ABC transporter permease n=1 Tax=Acrocarpospora pleiomorpha TaxID=90975 RepID=A0A5M3Y1A3_9ACTN|nr:ABC-2 family transporter protein [Acrocarpospora pleiomorpha]GES27117.1 hypothetical protein Aple_100160 [Acrocarpospora pleiomorpha]